ncbi:MAG TPA: efflux transporter outer membrane subunit [Candidatus Binatia bacterium]
MKRQSPTMALRAGVTVLALLTAGCTVGPDFRRPDTPVPATWSEARYEGIDTRRADLARWWEEFNDPVLTGLANRAAGANLDLRLAEGRIREARALRRVAESGAWPAADVRGAYSRSRTSENAFSSSSQGSGGSSSTGGGNRGQDLFRAGFDSSWEVDVFGGVRRSVESADATVEASIEDRRDVLVTLLGDIARNYIDLRGFQRRLAVAQNNLKAQQESLEITRVRFQAGLANYLQVSQAEAQVNTTAAEIPALEALSKQAAHRLDVLLGIQPGALSAELSTEAPIPALPPQAHVGLPSELLRRRPDIRRAERQLAAANAEIGVATADLYPRFSLSGAFGVQSISASDWFSAPSRFWSIGPTIRWPIFDAGRIRANIEVRNARQEQALTAYEKTVLTAFEDVENALVSYAKEQLRYRSLMDAVVANRRAVAMADELYKNGLIDFLNVLDSQRALYSAESDVAQSEAAMATNLVALYKALGGGWEN